MSVPNSGVTRPPDTGDPPQNSNSNTENQQPQRMNYAMASQSLNFPKRDQAIVLHAVNGYTVKEYVSEIIKVLTNRISDLSLEFQTAESVSIYRLKKSPIN